MKDIRKHIVNTVLAGIVATLPVMGLIFMVAYLESELRPLAGMIPEPLRFPGIGIVLVIIFLYLVGLAASSIAGRWVMRYSDSVLHRIPGIGTLYKTIKQILGYGEDEGAIFRRVVLVRGNGMRKELGLVTEEVQDLHGEKKLTVFVPGSPNPGNGRLFFMDPDGCEATDFTVDSVLKTLLSLGKTSLITRKR
ncbi:MAG: DUF502 domain-containing protein [bacterium]